MLGLGRLLGRKDKALEVAKADQLSSRPTPDPVGAPWGIILATSIDLMVSIKAFDPQPDFVCLVHSPSFADPARGLSPFKAVATMPDGSRIERPLANIPDNAVELLLRFQQIGTVIIQEIEGLNFARMHQAGIFERSVGRAPEHRQLLANAPVYDAKVLEVLSKGDATRHWQGFCALRKDGELVSKKAYVSLDPAPVLVVGDVIRISGDLTIEPEPWPADMKQTAVLTDSERLRRFMNPFEFQICTPDVDEEAARNGAELIDSSLFMMMLLAGKMHGYDPRSLVPYIRRLDSPRDEFMAKSHREAAVKLPQGKSWPEGPKSLGNAVPWDLAADMFVVIGIDVVSQSEPVSAELFVHPEPLIADDGPASPLLLEIDYSDGSTRKLILSKSSDEVTKAVAEAFIVNVIELTETDEATWKYGAKVTTVDKASNHARRP